MNAAKYMWMYSCQKYGLPNSADHGCTSTALPFCSLNPVGWFIQPFTEITKNEPVTPAIATGTPHSRCRGVENRSQPYT